MQKCNAMPSIYMYLLAHWAFPYASLGIQLQVGFEIKTLYVATLAAPGRQHYTTECDWAFQRDRLRRLLHTIRVSRW